MPTLNCEISQNASPVCLFRENSNKLVQAKAYEFLPNFIVNRLHSNSSVDRAGKILIQSDSEEVHSILSAWRALHAYPLRHVALILTDLITQIDPEAIIAQRLKQFPSIRQKLQDRPQMAS